MVEPPNALTALVPCEQKCFKATENSFGDVQTSDYTDRVK